MHGVRGGILVLPSSPRRDRSPRPGHMDQPELSRRVAEVRARLAQHPWAGRGRRRRSRRASRIVAVTKGRDQPTAAAAVAAGLCDLGENYAQELLEKAPGWRRPAGTSSATCSPTRSGAWRPTSSSGRASTARACCVRSPATVRGRGSWSRSRRGRFPGRGGCDPATARRLVAEAVDLGLHPAGLMSMALPGPPEAVRRQFRQVRGLADELELPVRSMGTSGDFTLAVEEGANLLRLGRVLLGDPAAAPG